MASTFADIVALMRFKPILPLMAAVGTEHGALSVRPCIALIGACLDLVGDGCGEFRCDVIAALWRNRAGDGGDVALGVPAVSSCSSRP